MMGAMVVTKYLPSNGSQVSSMYYCVSVDKALHMRRCERAGVPFYL